MCLREFNANLMTKRQVLFFFFFTFFATFCLQAEGGEEVSLPEWSAPSWDVLEWEKIEGNEVHIFANSSASAKQTLGTAKLPFKTIDDALSHIATLKKKGKKIKVVLNIKGRFVASYSYVINYPIKIVGLAKNSNTNIEFRKNTGFMLSSSFLMLENVSLVRKEGVGEPRTVPLFYSSSAQIKLKDVKIDVKEGGGLFFFRSSKFELSDVVINSIQADYCNIMEVSSSKGKISSCKFICHSKSAIALDVNKSEVIVDGLLYEISSSYFSFFVRAFASSLNVANTSLKEKEHSKERRVAIIYDKVSQLQEHKVTLSGFAELAAVRSEKFDYLK